MFFRKCDCGIEFRKVLTVYADANRRFSNERDWVRASLEKVND
jgi:hypothetical protein